MSNRKKAIIWIGIAIVFVGLLHLFQGILLPFVVSLLLAYFLNPAVNRLQKWKMSRGAATLTIVSVFLLSVVSFFLVLIPILQTQIAAFMMRIPTYATSVWSKIQSIIHMTRQTMSPDQLYNLQNAVSKTVFNALSSVGDMALGLLSGGVAFFSVISLLLIIPVVLFYVLRDWNKLSDETMSLIPKKNEAVFKSVLGDINKTLAGFIRGQATVCLILAIFYSVGLTLSGVELGALIGVLTGLLSFVPYFGFLTGVVLSVLLALAQGAGWGVWIGLLVVFSIGQVLESYVLTPKLVGENVGLHPAWVIFALLAGGVVFGFVGVLVAVPVAAVIGVLVRRGVAYYKTSALYKGKK